MKKMGLSSAKGKPRLKVAKPDNRERLAWQEERPDSQRLSSDHHKPNIHTYKIKNKSRNKEKKLQEIDYQRQFQKLYPV